LSEPRPTTRRASSPFTCFAPTPSTPYRIQP
jgi:hypothetical protein